MKLNILRCPQCKGQLALRLDILQCPGCQREYSLWHGIPVLLLPDRSLFDAPSEAEVPLSSRWRDMAKRLVPPMGHNLNSRDLYGKFSRLLKASNAESAVVLVVGSGRGGIGIDQLAKNRHVELINLDVAPNFQLDVIGDAHHLPIEDGSLDGVVIQAVLEHVLEPQKVVAEILRVLKPNGVVYAETPFMQMVHERAYDYTRFSDLGHRYLFRDFEQIERGITGGPGMTLLWAWCYFLRAFSRSNLGAKAAMAFGRLTGFWLLWLDRFLGSSPGAYDACSGVYFLGRKGGVAITPRDMIGEYRGL